MARAEANTGTPFARGAIASSEEPAPRNAGAREAAPLYAALDLGTNNCRLLLAVPKECDFHVVGSFSRIVRLGEGLASTGLLAEAAIERTIQALGVCSRRIEKAAATHVRCVATEACRQARNGLAFMRRAHTETGIALEPISIREEAHLTFSGCRALMESNCDHILLFDIGGGSTEVIWAKNGSAGPHIEAVMSMPLGVVTLAERFGGLEMSEEFYQAIMADVALQLGAFDAAHGISEQVARGGVQMIGTSGTVTTLGAFTLGLDRYQRSRVDGMDITFDQMLAANARLKAMNAQARADHACVGPDRADLVLGGCAVLEAVCRLWPIGRLRIGDRGIREGLLHAMIAAETGDASDAPPTQAGSRP